jgi:hypothetical protein
MKYFFLVLILVACGLAYVRSEQPKIWNASIDSLAALKVPEDASTASSIGASPGATSDVAAGPVTPHSTAQEIISPDSTNFINSDHVKQVDQPTQPNANPVANVSKVFVPPDPLPEQPNWTWTVLGKDYHNVVVTKVEADCVHIIYDGGVVTLNTSDLSPDLQKMFNYDPQTAALASQQKAAAQAQADAQQAPK